jgi:hypothetical protein
VETLIAVVESAAADDENETMDPFPLREVGATL